MSREAGVISVTVRTILLVAALLWAAVVVWALLWVRRELLIDGCLDMGSRWDYALDECEPLPRGADGRHLRR